MKAQEILITEAKNNVKATDIVETSDRFLFLMDQFNVKDLWDSSKINIQKDNGRYIFSLNNNGHEYMFSVAPSSFKEFITDFVDREKAIDEHAVIELNGLQLNIFRWSDPRLQEYAWTEKEYQKLATDPENISERITLLKDFFTNQKNESFREKFWISSKYAKTSKERDYRRINEVEAKNRLKKLKNLERSFDDAMNWRAKDQWLNNYLVENDLKNISHELDELSDMVPQFILQRNSLINREADITPTYDMELTKLNKRQLKRLLKRVKDHNKNLVALTALGNQFWQQHMRARDLSALEQYLEDVTNTKVDPTLIPFTPEHKEQYKVLLSLYSDLQGEFPVEDKKIDEKTTNNEQIITGTTTNTPLTRENTTDNTILNTPEGIDTNKGFFSYTNEWTKWIQNTTERGQNFYRSFGNIALLAGGIFLGVKALRSTWRLITGKSKKENTLGKDFWRLGWAAGLLLFTAGRPQDLFKWGEGATSFNKILAWITGKNNKENNVQSSNSIEGVAQAITGASLLFGSEATYGKIKDMVSPGQDGKMRIKPEIREKQLAYYTDIVNNPSGKTAEEVNTAKARKEFLEQIGKNDQKGIVHLALTGVGLPWSELSKPENKDIPFTKQANEVISRALNIGTYMDSRGYTKTNTEVDKRITDYVTKGTPTLEELETEWVFEKAVNIQPEVKSKLDAQIDALTGLTDEQKKQLREALYQFYMDLPEPKKDTLIENKDGKLVLTTYGESTPLDLDNKAISGLMQPNGLYPMQFPMTKEMLRVAHLTNYINSITRNLTPTKKQNNPFYIEPGVSGVGKRIAFDNTERYEAWKKDTTMISNNWLESISRQLANDKNKEAYAAYLNGLQYWKWGRNNESTVVIPTPVIIPEETILEWEEIDANIINQENLQKDLDEIDKLDLSDAAKTKIKKDYKEFYKKYPSIKTIWVELIADWNTLNVKSYRKTTPIDFNENKVAGLNIDFGNFEDMFKTANLTNKIRSTFENIPSETPIDPFHQDLDDIAFNDKAIWNRRPDVSVVSDGLWRGSLRKVSPKLAESSNKQLYIKYLNDLWLMQDKAGWFFPVIEKFNNFDTRQKIIDGFKSFYKNHSSEEKNIKFKQDENKNIFLETYEQPTPIDIASKKIIGLDISFGSYEELFKVANLINKAKSVTKDKEIDGDEAFDVTYLWALEFYGTAKTIRVFSEDGLIQNSEKFYERPNKILLEDYLNKRWRDTHWQTTPEATQ